ncbi:unnamed protein product [Ilex paraguariensis]|uniref:Uncharacterized protein n=1 Tax=Ilex paraguariensis TaxID=185542 RepID=A0ABC8SF59_9AQUA
MAQILQTSVTLQQYNPQCRICTFTYTKTKKHFLFSQKSRNDDISFLLHVQLDCPSLDLCTIPHLRTSHKHGQIYTFPNDMDQDTILSPNILQFMCCSSFSRCQRSML